MAVRALLIPHPGTKRGALERLVGAICVALEAEFVPVDLHRLLSEPRGVLLHDVEDVVILALVALVALRQIREHIVRQRYLVLLLNRRRERRVIGEDENGRDECARHLHAVKILLDARSILGILVVHVPVGADVVGAVVDGTDNLLPRDVSMVKSALEKLLEIELGCHGCVRQHVLHQHGWVARLRARLLHTTRRPRFGCALARASSQEVRSFE